MIRFRSIVLRLNKRTRCSVRCEPPTQYLRCRPPTKYYCVQSQRIGNAQEGVAISRHGVLFTSPHMHGRRHQHASASSDLDIDAGAAASELVETEDVLKSDHDTIGSQLKEQVEREPITFERGKLALLADGAVVARSGDTVITASAVSNRRNMDETGFLPLSVEYRQKAHARGKIPATRDRQERSATGDEILVARAIDRVLRPLFPPGYCFDTQIIATVQALEPGGDPVMLAINAASAALSVSNIPWNGPAACVRVGRVGGQIVINPAPDTFEPTDWAGGGGLDLLYAANEDRVLMIEMGGGPVNEEQLMPFLRAAHRHIKPVLQSQRELMAQSGRDKDWPLEDAKPTEEMLEEAMSLGLADAKALFDAPAVKGKAKGRKRKGKNQPSDERPSKEERGKAEGEFLSTIRKNLVERFPDAPNPAILSAGEAVLKQAMRQSVVEGQIRPDGRKLSEMRTLTSEADVLPMVHGSGLFTRGQTQTLAVVTLGPALENPPPSFLGEDRRPSEQLQAKLYLHYEFPPYSVNETGKVGQNRRMVGHGRLAEKSLLPVMPPVSSFPYTTRVTAEVMMSNGSSSMATTSAASMALMDAGVPVKAAVGGVSVGLMTTDASAEGTDIGDYVLLTDLQGSEDHYGDMDFKVAGTSAGITGIQLDVKLRGGVPLEVLDEALAAARVGRMEVLENMGRAISGPRPTLKGRAPRCEIIRFEPDRKKDLVGFQGQTLKGIEDGFGVRLDLSVEGRAVVFAEEAKNVEEALRLIRELVHEIEKGELYTGVVTEVHEFGCLVELLKNQEALLHVSNMTDQYPAPPAREIVTPGQELSVRVVEVDKLRRLIRVELESSRLARLEAAPAGSNFVDNGRFDAVKTGRNRGNKEGSKSPKGKK